MERNDVEIEMFKVGKETKRFRLNQKVWITGHYANYLEIRHKWSGRWVTAHLAKWDTKYENLNPIIKEIKKIKISKKFADFLLR